ncbi:MAG: hypothetical protein KKD29_00960 [Candidatus Omnitrophica bacterium]|nr:hypothetical protein [Candidatus Omnitrophota bacterium]MBU4487606.1 hypothetical protein [Candidatus Omnitrophota bacterium]MCG2705689.1 hypothetical protein [Candidatus Omnitrophota bacterium]
MKKIYLRVILVILISGLLCPQALLAEEQPYEVREGDEKPLVSFDEYENLKLREEELLTEKQNVEVAEETLISEKIQNIITAIETDKYFITREEYSDKIMKIVVHSKEDDEKNINIEFNENKVNTLSETRIEYKGIVFLVYLKLGNKEAEQLPATLDENIDDLFHFLDKAINASSATTLSESSGSTTMSQQVESATHPSKTYESKLDSSPNVPGEFGSLTFPDLSPLLNNLFAALDQSFNDAPVAETESTDNNSDSIFKAPEIKDSKSETAAFVRKEIGKLAEAHNLAKSAFYKKTAKYYSKLASALEKAHWLWMAQGLDIRLYINAEGEFIDSEEARKIIEGAVDYLYGNVPTAERELALRGEIFELEKTLRAEYIDPALESYKDKIQKASMECYDSINEEIKVLINPSINYVDGAVEVIIILPEESAK